MAFINFHSPSHEFINFHSKIPKNSFPIPKFQKFINFHDNFQKLMTISQPHEPPYNFELKIHEYFQNLKKIDAIHAPAPPARSPGKKWSVPSVMSASHRVILAAPRVGTCSTGRVWRRGWSAQPRAPRVVRWSQTPPRSPWLTRSTSWTSGTVCCANS